MKVKRESRVKYKYQQLAHCTGFFSICEKFPS